MAVYPHVQPPSCPLGQNTLPIKYHFVRNFFNLDPTFDRSSRHPFVLEKIDTDKQKADLFTKGFAAEKFATLRKLLCGW